MYRRRARNWASLSIDRRAQAAASLLLLCAVAIYWIIGWLMACLPSLRFASDFQTRICTKGRPVATWFAITLEKWSPPLAQRLFIEAINPGKFNLWKIARLNAHTSSRIYDSRIIVRPHCRNIKLEICTYIRAFDKFNSWAVLWKRERERERAVYKESARRRLNKSYGDFKGPTDRRTDVRRCENSNPRWPMASVNFPGNSLPCARVWTLSGRYNFCSSKRVLRRWPFVMHVYALLPFSKGKAFIEIMRRRLYDGLISRYYFTTSCSIIIF